MTDDISPIRIGIAREEWRVVIHIPEKRLPVERAVFGTREDAKTEARSMINAWMKKRDKARGSPTNVAKLPELCGRLNYLNCCRQATADSEKNFANIQYG